jgi:PadR family transcriptional regulator, regulatory protein PadR
MVLKTLESMGSLHGYGIARRIEQTSRGLLSLNYGTLYPALLKSEQEGTIVSEWGVSENNRRAKLYKLSRAGKKQLERETQDWEQTTAILARFLAPRQEA